MNFGAIEENYMLNSFKYFYNVPHKFRIFKMRSSSLQITPIFQ